MLGVTGATGGLGGRVAARLAKRGVPQKLIVRDASRVPALEGAEVAGGASYADADALRAAFDGVSTLYLVSAGEAPDRVELHRNAVEAAVAAGVERIVYTSFLAAAPDATFTFARDHWATEELVRATGLPFTFMRSSMYLDYVPIYCNPDGTIRGPAGEGRIASIARDDVTDAAVEVLLADGAHDGATFDMTGGEAITVDEMANRLGAVVGRPVVYERETLEEARASRAPSGAADWEIEGWVTSYAAIATGEMDVVSDAVERLAGHPPQTLEDFLRAHPESYAHLR